MSRGHPDPWRDRAPRARAAAHYDGIARALVHRLKYGDRVELAPKLMDDAWLDSFAPGTVGAAYRDFVRSEQLSAEGLAEVSRQDLTIENGKVTSYRGSYWVQTAKGPERKYVSATREEAAGKTRRLD